MVRLTDHSPSNPIHDGIELFFLFFIMLPGAGAVKSGVDLLDLSLPVREDGGGESHDLLQVGQRFFRAAWDRSPLHRLSVRGYFSLESLLEGTQACLRPSQNLFAALR